MKRASEVAGHAATAVGAPWSGLLAALLVLCWLPACGPGGSGQPADMRQAAGAGGPASAGQPTGMEPAAGMGQPVGTGQAADLGQSTRDRVLNLYSWAEYFPDSVIRQFEAETGIKVNYSVFDSNDVAETTLSAGQSGFDLVTVNASPHLERQIPKGLWRPLDRSKLRNLANVDAGLLQILSRVDPGNRYAIPYMWGTTGLIYNPDAIRAILPAAPVESLAMVFQPRLASRFKRCGISVLDSWVDMLPLISAYLGQADLSADPGALDAMAKVFAAASPSIRRVTSSGYYDQLARGELCLAIGYSADAMVARRHALELGNGVHINYSQPSETVRVYIDAYAIPSNARNVDAALRFIDFTLRPDIGVEIGNSTGFAIANSAAVERLEPELRDNPVVYPPPEVRKRFTLGRGYTMEETRLFSRAWLHMKTGH